MALLAGLLACAPSTPPAIDGHVWVPVTTRDLAVGEEIPLEEVRLVALPPDLVPEGVIRTAEEVVGHAASQRILAYELLRPERIGPAVSTFWVGDVGFLRHHRPREGDTVTVVVSAGPLEAGHTVVAADVVAIERSETYVPINVFPTLDLVVGRTTCEPVLANEQIRAERLLDPATGRCSVP